MGGCVYCWIGLFYVQMLSWLVCKIWLIIIKLKWLKQVDPKHAMRSLPKPVLCRIRELATIHPYPRVPYSKKCNGDTDSSRHPIKAKSAPFSSHGRNLRRTTIKEQWISIAINQSVILSLVVKKLLSCLVALFVICIHIFWGLSLDTSWYSI